MTQQGKRELKNESRNYYYVLPADCTVTYIQQSSMYSYVRDFPREMKAALSLVQIHYFT